MISGTYIGSVLIVISVPKSMKIIGVLISPIPITMNNISLKNLQGYVNANRIL